VCRNATSLLLVASAVAASAQSIGVPALEWRPVGTTVIDAGLSSPASGPADRVWYSADGQTTFVRTRSGRVWQTSDGEKWTVSGAVAPVLQPPAAERLPEPVVKVARAGVLYAVGENVWRSENGGLNWTTLTSVANHSILGGRLWDIAVSPVRPEELTVAGETGLWRSVDGGASWAGLNDTLPNLPAARILAVPSDGQTLRIASFDGTELIWLQGERSGWRVAQDSLSAAEDLVRARIPGSPSAAVRAGDVVYAGFPDGRLMTSADRGRTWTDSPRGADGTASVLRLYSDERGPSFALAITASIQRGRVMRTVNRGAFWDDITANLPSGPVHGIAADRLTGAVYVATDAGVFFTYTDTTAAGPATPWTRLREEPARDVMLDSGANQLYVALDGAGVFAAMAPHRIRDPRVVSAGDRVLRPVAPGSLLSVIGARVNSAQAGGVPASVLAANELESQVQLPMDLSGSGVLISMNSTGGRIQIGLPVTAASPSIFVDKDGNPLIMNADTGLMLDAGKPARSRARLQVLVSGLGRVSPNWPVGIAAPLQDPPRVIAPVLAYLDRERLNVVRATLAPGYIGLYLVEVEVPAIVNHGSAEFYLQAGEESSNRVRIWIEP
jgi:uncharacterized protein (TIGR03437 family)